MLPSELLCGTGGAGRGGVPLPLRLTVATTTLACKKQLEFILFHFIHSFEESVIFRADQLVREGF
jgi:hypothetical protein